MEFWVLVFVFIAAGLVFGIVKEANTSKRKKEMELKLKSLHDFNPTQQIMGCDGKSGIAVDELQKKICLITNNGIGASLRVIYCKDIFSVELFEDGASITRTVRSSQVGGAIVGGLLLGGVGALVGGLSGKTETSGKIKRIDLRLIVNDTNSPLHDVSFMNVEGKKNGFVYSQAMQKARRWHGVVEILIKRADSEEKILQNSELKIQPAPHNNSVADEIKKLSELHHSGVLTSDEFKLQKARLLAANQLVV